MTTCPRRSCWAAISAGLDATAVASGELGSNRRRSLTVARLFLTTPLRTCVEAILEVENFVESVVAADLVCRALESRPRMVTRWSTTTADFAAWTGSARRWHGGPAIDSPWETRLRLFYRQRAGLPKPWSTARFQPRGTIAGHFDLFDPEAALATEFDGKDHRSRRQHRAGQSARGGPRVSQHHGLPSWTALVCARHCPTRAAPSSTCSGHGSRPEPRPMDVADNGPVAPPTRCSCAAGSCGYADRRYPSAAQR